MSMPNLPSYPIPLDGQAHVVTLPPPYVAHGLIVVNGGAVALTVTSSRGQRWTVGPGGRLEAPLPESVPIYTLQSVAADDTGGTASATFVTELIAVESNTGIASTTLPDVLLMPFTSPSSPFTSLAATITLTSDIQSLTIGLLLQTYNITPGTSTLIGATSGYLYWQAPSNSTHASLNQYSIPVYPAIDSTLNLVIHFDDAGGGEAVCVIGHRYLQPAGLNPSGALQVALSVGQYPLPVTMSAGPPAPNYRAADYSAYALQINPAAATNYATISNLPAGAYYIEWAMGSESSPAAASKKCYLLNVTGSQFLMAVSYPGIQSGAITGYYSSAVWSLAVQNGIAITDGTYLLAALRVWKI